MNEGPKAPPGWYAADGVQRYWDGSKWTDYTAENYWELQSKASKMAPLPFSPETPTPHGKPWHRMWQVWLGIAFLSCSGLGILGNAVDPQSDTIDTTSQSTSPGPEAKPSPAQSAATTKPTASASPKPTPTKPKKVVALLFVANQKDGDSWVASNGKEYRLGLVNAPEVNEECSGQATAFTRQFLASGFTVDDYSTDTYGRHVAEVFDKSGKSLNVALAKSGLGDDRYLAEFRHENPELARRLDQAFASAADPSCAKTAAPVPFVKKPTPSPSPSPKPYVAPLAKPNGSGSSDSGGSGAHAVCRDGSLSYSQHRSGTCSHHGGVAEWLW